MSYYVRVERWQPRGLRFSPTEVAHILIAVSVLTVSFAFAFVGGFAGLGRILRLGGGLLFALILGASFLAVVTGFLLHELAHKAVAQRYGCFAEFRYYAWGLILGLVTALLGFMFAAPGAVLISGPVSARQHVRISAAGPGTNLAIAIVFIGLSVSLGVAGGGLSNVATIVIGTVAFVNLFLGGFNLIPFPPLDGSKIWAFDKGIWIALVAVLAVVFAAGWTLGVFFL